MQPKLYIEEVKEEDKPIEENKALTDEQLHKGGLVKVEAFVRTKSSAAAVRKARQRERQKEEGLKQINITAPAETHAFFKTVAKSLTEGKKVEEAIKESVTSHGLVTLDELTKRKIEIGEKVLSLTGWKKVIAKLIGIIP